MSGVFITMEGGEGVGKSTNLAFVGECLTAAGKAVRMTREPGGTALGDRIRAILLDRGAEGMGVDAELLLMFAARARTAYLGRAQREPARFRLIDASCPLHEVQAQLRQVLSEFCSNVG